MCRLMTVLALTCVAGSAQGGVTFEFIGDGIGASGVSADGSVIVGNIVADNSYETFRWTAETGVVRLGAATVPVLGTGAGAPEVSDDGARISATILSEDQHQMCGVWHDGFWEECWPLPPDGGAIDSSYSSAWGITGDGLKAVGLYWRPGNPGGGGAAHAMQWTSAAGTVSLSMPGAASSRANGANFDGSVIAGWEASPTGPWQPTVWVNGAKTILQPVDEFSGGGQAWAVSNDGSTVVGSGYSQTQQAPIATRWVFDGAEWDEFPLGVLPGTPIQSGRSFANGASADGSVIIGTNYFFFNGPFSSATGFIWTQETGMVNIRDFLAANGVKLDPDFSIAELSDISPDGHTIIGIGRQDPESLLISSFRITITSDCPSDLDGDGLVGAGDLALLLGSWGQSGVPADFDGDGVGASDLAQMLGSWGACE